MLSKKVEKALNAQHDLEAYSAYIYYAMAAWCEAQNWSGFANWMKMQAGEEMLIHALKIFDYVNERGGEIKPGKIDAPVGKWKTLLDVFKAAYDHERKVTASIYKLVDTATEADDKATVQFLQWFIEEQVEEEAQTDDIVQKLKKIGDSTNGLFMLDRALAARKFGGE